METEAFETLYGGGRGGGKSFGLLAIARNFHRRSLILRRNFAQLEGSLIDDSKRIFNPDFYNLSRHVWDFPDGVVIRFGHVQNFDDVYAYDGSQYDLLGLDQLEQFSLPMYQHLFGVVRTSYPNQRVRIIGTANPVGEGVDWIIERWSPWLDGAHSHPAKPGELRWFARVEGKDVPCESGKPFQYKHETIEPRSRTFIPALVVDNPHLNKDYVSTLQAYPEPLRSQMLYGRWDAREIDDPYQVIKRSWVELAMSRWTEDNPFPRLPMALGVDVAYGGCFDDQTEILTDEGWKFFENLHGKENVLSLDGEVAVWGKIEQIHQYPFEGELNLYDGTRVNFCITDNHRLLWVNQDGRVQMSRYDEMPRFFRVKRTNTWQGSNPATVRFVSEVEMPHGGFRKREWIFDFNDWARLVGWFVSEGSVFQEQREGGRWVVNIAQNEGKKLDALKELLDRMGISYWSNNSLHAAGISFSIYPIARTLAEDCGVGSHHKRIPVYIKEASEEGIDSFLETYRLGDGTRNRRGTSTYFSTSRQLIDDLHEILAKVGRAGKVSLASVAGSAFSIGLRRVLRKYDGWSIVERKRSVDSDVDKRQVKRVLYNGYVYCVTTPLHTIMVRRKGCVMWSGNSDKTVLSKCYGTWFDRLITRMGVETPDGKSTARLVVNELTLAQGGNVMVDLVGYGSSAYDQLKDSGYNVVGLNGGATSEATDRGGQVHFANKRTEVYWRLREALDPAYGLDIRLPPDDELKSDLVAPRWDYRGDRIRVEPKEDVKERIGRSPDKADAVCYAWAMAQIEAGSKSAIIPNPEYYIFDD